MIKEGVHYDMTDEVYHKQHSREEHYYSSSQLKTMLEDPLKFRDHYIKNKKPATPQALQDAFDTGTLAHTAILEPTKLKGSYVLWKTGNRTGKIWDKFKEDNEGKLVLTTKMKEQAENAIKAIKKSKLSKELFNDGQAEVSFFVDFHGLKVKVRADWLGGNGIITDLKTTTGNVRDAVSIKNKIKKLNYDLSAAFYVDVVNYCIDKFEIDIPHIGTFYWVFASKDKGGYSQIYDALDYLPMGRAKYRKAIADIKKHEANGWEFPEEIIRLQPFGYEVSDWIKPEPKVLDELKEELTETEEEEFDL